MDKRTVFYVQPTLLSSRYLEKNNDASEEGNDFWWRRRGRDSWWPICLEKLGCWPNDPPEPHRQDIPPIVHPVEKTLPRAHRTALSQLRSGYCKALNSFQNLLNPSTPITCPECDSGETHTTQHLFRCPTHPTDLCVEDLWLRPDLSAHFISTLPSFHYLPALPSPPPEPPPTPTVLWNHILTAM